MANIRTNVQRSNVNETNVKFNDHPKSGYSLSHTSQMSGKLGKLHPIGYQYIMPNDKISGETKLNIQFEPLSVPMIAPLQVHTHNFYVPFRDVIGSDFEEFMSPENGYAPDVSLMPMFTLRDVVLYLNDSLGFPIGFSRDFSGVQNLYSSEFPSFIAALKPVLVSSKLGDFYDEYIDHYNSLGQPTSSDWSEWAVNAFTFLLQPFIGEGSYLDFLGYPIFDNYSIRVWVTQSGSPVSLLNYVSTLPLSELPLRCLWAIWFDRYRNVNVERKRDFYQLGLNYKKWSATPLSMATLFHLLLPRYRNWTRDMFTSAMIDDPSRHVYAQVNSSDPQSFGFVDSSDSYTPASTMLESNMFSRGLISYTLNYLSEDGVERTITLPLPSSIIGNGSLDSVSSDGYERLDLLVLRRAKMFENYLKRNMYFGDEYQDRMAAHYGSRVSDSRVNRPEYLSGNTSQVNTQVTTANVSTADTDAGQRTAYMDAQQDGGDRFDFYCEEFGMVITIMSVTPAPFYDPMPAQLVASKLMDFPFPEFANQNEELSRRFMIQRTALESAKARALRPFGHHPQYVAWRGRVNDLHGNALSTRRYYTFSRVWNYEDDENSPVFNSNFVHCRPYLDMFISNDPLNDVWFGYIDKIFYVERVLPQVTEVI